MWTCPKCERAFKKTNQSHYCGKAPETIDEYIAEQEHKEELMLVRNTVRNALPDAQERISWSMPTYRMERNIVQFSAASKHIGFYPGPEAVSHFADRLEGYQFSKGSIRFPYKKEIPTELITEICRWCLETGNHV